MKEEKIKYLELIQSIIGRLANNSFLIKGWSVTVTLAGLSFYVTHNDPIILVSLVGAIFLFWFCDSYYLRQERLFRALYGDVASNKKEADFRMELTEYQPDVSKTFVLMFSYPNLILYLALLLVTIIQMYYKMKIEINITVG